MNPGRCSSCHQPAIQAPSGRWWHQHEPCEQRSRWLFLPIFRRREPDGTISIGPSGDRPARFEAA